MNERFAKVKIFILLISLLCLVYDLSAAGNDSAVAFSAESPSGSRVPVAPSVDVFPYETGFEEQTFPPQDWAVYDMDGMQPQWEVYEGLNHTPGGSKSAEHAMSEAATQDGWLVSPPLELPVEGFTLSFWSYNANPAEYGNHGVYVSDGSPNPADNDYVSIWSPLTVSANWYQTYVDLSPWNGQTIYVAFRYQGLAAHNWYIDDIRFDLYQPVSDFPLQENFESGVFPPYYWVWFDEDGMYAHWNWLQGENHTPDGNCAALHGYVEDEPAQDGWLVSPELTIPIGQAFMMSFWSYNPYNQAYGSNSVHVTSGSIDPTDGEYMQIWSPLTVTDHWKQNFVDLSPWAGQTINVAFRYQGLNAHSWYLDDVTFSDYYGIAEFPYTEDFESGVFPPYYWTAYDQDGSGTYWSWNQELPLNHSEDGRCSAMHIWDAEEPAEDGWLVSPRIRVPETGICTMTFWSKNFNPQWYGSNSICVSTTSPEPWSGNYAQIWMAPTVSEDWEQGTIDLSVWSGQSIYLAFRYQGFDAHDWYLDDVEFSVVDADGQPPVITHLPLINTIRDDVPYGVYALVEDDPVWNSGISAVWLFYKINEGDWILSAMNPQGDGYFAEIPAQPLSTQVTYVIVAVDASPQANTLYSQGYTFWVNDPNWIYYHDNIQTTWAGMSGDEWGMGVLYENPYRAEAGEILVNAVSGALLYDDTVSVHVYSCEDEQLTDLTEAMSPVGAFFPAMTGTDVPLTDVAIDSPYLFIMLQNIDSDNYFACEEGIYYPDRCFIYWDGQFLEFGDLEFYNVWMLNTEIQTGSENIAAPELTITLLDGEPVLQWSEVPGADLYTIYSATDPYQEHPWYLYDTTNYPELGDIAQDPQRFFEVTANVPPVRLRTGYWIEPQSLDRRTPSGSPRRRVVFVD